MAVPSSSVVDKMDDAFMIKPKAMEMSVILLLVRKERLQLLVEGDPEKLLMIKYRKRKKI